MQDVALLDPSKVPVLTTDTDPGPGSGQHIDAHTHHGLRDLRRWQAWLGVDRCDGRPHESGVAIGETGIGKTNDFVDHGNAGMARMDGRDQFVDRSVLRGLTGDMDAVFTVRELDVEHAGAQIRHMSLPDLIDRFQVLLHQAMERVRICTTRSISAGVL